MAQVAARLAPALPGVCDCRGTVHPGDPALELCGTPIKIESLAELQASTNGRRIRLTTGMLRFLRHDDELAFVLAHELSHILLGHAGAFDGPSLREAEIEADRLGIQIVSRAGFDTEIAAKLPERLAQSYPTTNRRSAAYGLPAERSAMIASALGEGLGRRARFDPQGLCGPQG
ncbi:MAG: M48 family metalloprotease [Kiloniellales bacterium]|nr:M48 family metalloprotease [Kiloniellales bacterium]